MFNLCILLLHVEVDRYTNQRNYNPDCSRRKLLNQRTNQDKCTTN